MIGPGCHESKTLVSSPRTRNSQYTGIYQEIRKVRSQRIPLKTWEF